MKVIKGIFQNPYGGGMVIMECPFTLNETIVQMDNLRFARFKNKLGEKLIGKPVAVIEGWIYPGAKNNQADLLIRF